MKYPSRNTSTLFCEQVNTVTNLFEKWNQCERTVVMYALLKRLKYPSLKFLLNSIECTLLHHSSTTTNSSSSSTTTTTTTNSSSNSCNAMTMADINANDPKYLNKLFISYKTTQIVVVADKDTISCGSSDYLLQSIVVGGTTGSTGSGSTLCGFPTTESSNNLHHHNQNNKNCLRKEEILNDILCLLPLLKPGNDDAKKMYLSLIPIAVEDSVKSYVPTELVQQIFSYLLIHPAISNEDRR